MTDRPLTEYRAAELWDEHVPPSLNFQGWALGDRIVILAALRATFDAGQKYQDGLEDDTIHSIMQDVHRLRVERDAAIDRPWEPLNGGRVYVGDEVRRDHSGITSIAVVGRVDKHRDPWTAEGGLIGPLVYGTWYVRRPVQELPTKPGTVIVPAEGHEYIEAEVGGIAHRAREAVLGANGWWYGAWRKAEGDGLLSAMFPEHISAPTWKVEGE